ELGLRWLREHIGEHGGDPARIYLSGTSAGASLAAAVTLRQWVAEPGLPEDLVKGLVLFSGRYDRTNEDRENDRAAATRYVQNLTSEIERTPPHTIVVNTDDESAFPDVPENAGRITAAIQARGGSVERLVQPQADHFSSSRSLAEGNGAVFEAIRKMMQLS
ncbi:MAG TPA: carboxylesterase family protein, partial [Burkholderiales bacterium]|nr:carboxylesterase family protein [Burkholderiales bacterium]